MGCNTSSTKKAPAREGQPQETKTDSSAPPTLTEASAEERALTQLKLIFDSVDTSGDGSVSKDELATALDKDESLGTLIKEAGFQSKYRDLSELDTNKDGCVSWEEFKGNLKEQAVKEVIDKRDIPAAALPADEKVIKQLRAIFESIDKSGDDAVSKEELARKLDEDEDEHGLMKDGSFGGLIAEAKFNPNWRAFEALDTNADGLISWKEFEANLRGAAREDVLESGDVLMVAVEPEEKDDGDAPRCQCFQGW